MNPAAFVVFLPMVFSTPQPYQPPLIDKIETMIPHEEPVILPVCAGCVLVQNDESEIRVPDVAYFDLLSTSNQIMVTLKDGQSAMYEMRGMWTEQEIVSSGMIGEDLPDLWVKSCTPTQRTLWYQIKP